MEMHSFHGDRRCARCKGKRFRSQRSICNRTIFRYERAVYRTYDCSTGYLTSGACTSVTAARKGNAGIAIGNIVGSNIFNILFVIGTTALICTVPFESKFIIDTIIAVVVGAILWIGTYKHKELRRPCGIFMLLCYVAYFVYLCMM